MESALPANKDPFEGCPTEFKWHPISTDPCGPTVIVGNDKTGWTSPAYSYWGKAPFPLWISLDAEGMGRCRPTHWHPMPPLSIAVSNSEAA